MNGVRRFGVTHGTQIHLRRGERVIDVSGSIITIQHTAADEARDEVCALVLSSLRGMQSVYDVFRGLVRVWSE